MQWLFGNGADVNIKNHLGETSLHYAFKIDRMETVMLILNNGGDLNIINN